MKKVICAIFIMAMLVTGCNNSSNPVQSSNQQNREFRIDVINSTGLNLIAVNTNNKNCIIDTNQSFFNIEGGLYDFTFVLSNQYTNIEYYKNNILIYKDTSLVIE